MHLSIKRLVPLFIFYATTQAAAESFTLHDAIDATLKNAPAARTAHYQVESQQAAYTSATAPLLPQISGSGTAGVSGVGSAATNSWSAGISASQTIFDFGKSPAKRHAAHQSLEAARSDSGAAIQSLILATIEAYANYASGREQLLSAQNSLAAARSHAAYAQALIDAGRGTPYTLAKAVLDTANAYVACVKTEEALATARLTLENLTGTTIDPAAGLDPLPESIPPSDNASPETVLRPELAAAQARVEAARISLASIKSSRLPSLSVNGDAGYRSTFDTPPKALSWSAGARLSIPIFSGFATSASVASAEAALGSAKASLDATEASIRLDIQSARARCVEAEHRFSAVSAALSAATFARDIAQQKLTEGNGGALELSDAESAVATQSAALIAAKADICIARARFEKARGTLTPSFNP